MSIRFAKTADVSAMLEIYRPYVEQTAVSFEYDAPSPEEFARRLAAYTQSCPWLVYEQEGEILGYAYAAPAFERRAYAWCADMSIYLHPRARHRGIGQQLYTALEELLANQGYRILYALVTTDNPHSVRFHEAMGYVKVAEFPACGYKLGRWHGVIWLQKELFPAQSPESFPISWPALRHQSE